MTDTQRPSLAPTLGTSLDRADAVMEGRRTPSTPRPPGTASTRPPNPAAPQFSAPKADPKSLDLAATGTTSVIWLIGHRADYWWVNPPPSTEPYIHHTTAASPRYPGLYFPGLRWLHAWELAGSPTSAKTLTIWRH
jgi:putative flavoprotein involved in K+ transport